MVELTRRQEQVLIEFAALSEKGYPPTQRELMKPLGIKGLQAVNDHFKALHRKGYMRRIPGAPSRNWRLTQLALQHECLAFLHADTTGRDGFWPKRLKLVSGTALRRVSCVLKRDDAA